MNHFRHFLIIPSQEHHLIRELHIGQVPALGPAESDKVLAVSISSMYREEARSLHCAGYSKAHVKFASAAAIMSLWTPIPSTAGPKLSTAEIFQ